MRNALVLLVLAAGLGSRVFGASGNCEENAVSLSFAGFDKASEISLKPAYDPEEKIEDPESGVHYFKATLKRGMAYTVWTTGLGTNDAVSVSVYPADPKEDSDKDAPSAEFAEVEEADADQRLILYADDWYIDDEDPSESDPTSWTYYIEVLGPVGDTVTLHCQVGVVIPLGRADNPQPITPSVAGAKLTRRLELNDEYYFRARLQAGRLYWFGSSGGTDENALDFEIEQEIDEWNEASGEVVPVPVYDDPAYIEDANNFGVYVLPRETAYYTILVSGGSGTEDVGEVADSSFSLTGRLLSERKLADHAFVELNEANGFAATFEPGRLNGESSFAAGYFDEIIDESLFGFAAQSGMRYVVETTGAQTNLLMRVYDARGDVICENRGDGRSDNVRCAFAATATGRHYVGVCQAMEDPVSEVPAGLPVQIKVQTLTSGAGVSDAWDAGDDSPEGATALAVVPGTATEQPESVDVTGQGWHRLDRSDWADVFQIAGRKGVTYALRISLKDPAQSFNTLRAEVFTLSGRLEKAVAASGDVNADSDAPLTFTATANATYYVRLSVREGTGLDFPEYAVHAMGYAAEGTEDLGILTVVTHGTDAGTFSLGTETVKYAGGSSVLAAGPQTIKFGTVKGFSTPSPVSVEVKPGKAPTVVDVYYADTFDPKDDVAKTATAWTLKNVETVQARTLWPTDPEDNFSFAGVDGNYYDFTLRTAEGGDAVFSITNAQNGVLVENATEVRHLTLPKTTSKYILTVRHGTPEKTGGAYGLAGSFANVGAIKLAKTAVTAKENAAQVSITVNRTAKNGVVRVRYATVDETAKAGADYVAQSGVLEWADGDNKAKTIAIRLIPDLVAVYEGNKTFVLKVEPVEPEADNEYRAAFVGQDQCRVTLTEVSRAGTTVASTYAAKAPKVAKVTTEKVPLSSGTFYGVVEAVPGALTNGLPQLGSITLTASTAAVPALSAKVMLAGKTYTFRGSGWDSADELVCAKTFELVQKISLVSYTNRLTVTVRNGTTTNGVDWLSAGGEAELVMNVPDANGRGVQPEIRYAGSLNRQNAKIQDYLTAVTNFTGYYTMALLPQGVAPDVDAPKGNGYLTLTVDSKGTVKVAGLLADGTTKPSLSVPACALRVDEQSVSGWALEIPLFLAKSPYCFGGILRLRAIPVEETPRGTTAQVVVDAACRLVWNNDNPATTYAGTSGYALELAPCGGWYDTVFNLQTYYLGAALSVETASAADFPKEALGAGFTYSTEAEPNGFALDLEGDKVVYEKKKIVKDGTRVDLVNSANICNVAVKFARATGVYSGTCSLWSENEAGTALKEVTGLKHFGVFVLSHDGAEDLDWLGAGSLTQSVKVPTKPSATTKRAWMFSTPFNIRVVNEE